MDITLIYLIKSVILPPGLMLLMMLAGMLVMKRRPMLGKTLLTTGFGLLLLLSIPVVADFNMDLLQTEPALTARDLQDSPAQAIIILGGGRISDAPEYGTDISHPRVLLRLRYGMWLHRWTDLPILVTGGSVYDPDKTSEASLMANVLANDYGEPPAWLEERSRNTWENARFSREILESQGIKTIYLVTTAWHMPRARMSFEANGFQVIPAPTGASRPGIHNVSARDLLPDAKALHRNRQFIHELFGILWYRMRYMD